MGTIDLPGVGKVSALETVQPTENTKGEKAFDKMRSRSAFAVNLESGGKKWFDGACTIADSDGDLAFSSLDTRDLDKAQPKMDCGTHIVTGGTGKNPGIAGREQYACITVEHPAGEPPGSIAVDVPHNTVWEIK